MNPLSNERANSEFEERLCGSYVSILGSNFRTLYVRGSVASGEAKPGIADIDLILVVESSISQEIDCELRSSQDQVLSEIGGFTHIDLRTFEREIILGAEAHHNGKFLTKLMSVPLCGEDDREFIRPYRLDAHLAKRLYSGSVSSVERLCRKIESGRNVTASKLHSVSKLAIRSLFALDAERCGYFTRDLPDCLSWLSENRNEYEAQAGLLVKAAIGECNDLPSIRSALETLLRPLTEGYSVAAEPS